MSLRDRIDDARTLLRLRRPEAALTFALIVIAGASRRIYPRAQGFRDRDAFVNYLDERMSAFGMEALRPLELIKYKAKSQKFSHALYEEFRCGLIHEGDLPQGVAIDLIDPYPTLNSDSETFRVGLPWVNLLLQLVATDERFANEMQGVRDRHTHRLLYYGPGYQDDFEREYVRKFAQSPMRLEIVKRFVDSAGRDFLFEMSDEKIRAFWDEKVRTDPRAYDVANGMTGLTTLGWENDIPHFSEQYANSTFAKGTYRSASLNDAYRINDSGIQMLRAVLDNFVLRPLGDQ